MISVKRLRNYRGVILEPVEGRRCVEKERKKETMCQMRVSEGKALAPKPEDLSLIPKTPVVEGEN